MENKLGELYSELAQKIISMIPINWDRIYYLGEVEKEQLSWSSVFYFEETDSKIFVKSHNIPEKYSVSQQIYDELLVELNSLLLKIYRCFEENDQPVWDQLDFSLTSNGKFNVNFLYDKISENDSGQAKREIIWAYNSFGFKPKEGTFTRKLLNSYLNEK
ncbi:immunity protein YezG family protein [Carnobacterium gallinarum]|uniref:immunity protein YezG family protein n=1 Tax=Carnobacterium gallinarum TaxID=2749 RepID=UPI00054E54D7|nr:immunity protein YezG family protein [Carnobacterium gallinarum]